MKQQSIRIEDACTRDAGRRETLTLRCEARQGTREWQIVHLADISQAGFRIARMPSAVHLGEPLRLRIPGLQVLTARIRWREDEAIGCEFARPLHVAVFDHIVRQMRG